MGLTFDSLVQGDMDGFSVGNGTGSAPPQGIPGIDVRDVGSLRCERLLTACPSCHRSDLRTETLRHSRDGKVWVAQYIHRCRRPDCGLVTIETEGEPLRFASQAACLGKGKARRGARPSVAATDEEDGDMAGAGVATDVDDWNLAGAEAATDEDDGNLAGAGRGRLVVL